MRISFCECLMPRETGAQNKFWTPAFCGLEVKSFTAVV